MKSVPNNPMNNQKSQMSKKKRNHMKIHNRKVNNYKNQKKVFKTRISMKKQEYEFSIKTGMQSRKYKKGYIGLQDHDSQIWFRNIKIKKL